MFNPADFKMTLFWLLKSEMKPRDKPPSMGQHLNNTGKITTATPTTATPTTTTNVFISVKYLLTNVFMVILFWLCISTT